MKIAFHLFYPAKWRRNEKKNSVKTKRTKQQQKNEGTENINEFYLGKSIKHWNHLIQMRNDSNATI